ncbi:MAG: polymerase sigma-70 factor, subfamily [Frankiales bacterium]|jgi:hypothetical protein|nr:polymerase sigma-70 factor, subfamily [Frankiales bacterium]
MGDPQRPGAWGVSARAVEHGSRGLSAAEALHRLSPQHRQALLECYYGRSSIAEAAARLGVSSAAVKSRVHYALQSIRLTLEELQSIHTAECAKDLPVSPGTESGGASLEAVSSMDSCSGARALRCRGHDDPTACGVHGCE